MTDDEIREEVRAKFASSAEGQHPDWLRCMCEQAVRNHHERIAEQARLAFLGTQPTWEHNDVPHHPHSGHCLGCGRWLVEYGDSGYGPYWECPARCGIQWDWRFYTAEGRWKEGDGR